MSLARTMILIGKLTLIHVHACVYAYPVAGVDLVGQEPAVP